jgi:hypothetical protein
LFGSEGDRVGSAVSGLSAVHAAICEARYELRGNSLHVDEIAKLDALKLRKRTGVVVGKKDVRRLNAKRMAPLDGLSNPAVNRRLHANLPSESYRQGQFRWRASFLCPATYVSNQIG